VEYKAYPEHLSPQNAASIVSGYDIVLDCTDHPSSRYLISDICVLLHKPLVSASALRTDGQLMILNHPAAARGSLSGGPCYRCIFPIPPPADQVMSCGDGGILGPVVGVMGVLQALEAIKLVVAGAAERPLPSETSQLEEEQKITPTPAPALLLFSANSPSPFRTVKLRPRRPGCFACSGSSLLTLETLGSGSLDYVAFCGSSAPSSLLSPFDQITAPEYAKIRVEEQEHILLDVREKVQFEIAHLEGSVNVPFSKIQGARDGGSLEKLLPLDHSAEGEIGEEGNSDRRSIYVLCRMGNDSQVVTRKLKEFGLEKDGRVIREVRGGLRAWKRDVDRSWPEY
jgi:adenylyltransferase/sulfurtransferase